MTSTETAARRAMLHPYEGPRVRSFEIGDRAWFWLDQETYKSNQAAAGNDDTDMTRPWWCWLHDSDITDSVARRSEAMAMAELRERQAGMRWAAAALLAAGPLNPYAAEDAWLRVLNGRLYPLAAEQPAEVAR